MPSPNVVSRSSVRGTEIPVQNATISANWLRYLFAVALTGFGLVAAYVGFLTQLPRIDALPPPLIVNSLCADVKLQFFREHPPEQPSVLIVGSSIAWRDVNSARLVRADPRVRPLNAGFCGAQINQSRFVSEYFIQRYGSISDVVALIEPHDFRACAKTKAQLYPPEDADDYIYRRTWVWGLYLRYFDLWALQRNIRHLHAVRTGRDLTDPMTFTQYGDGPVPVSPGRDLVYGRFEGFDQSCFSQLHGMARDLAGQGRHFMVATAPLNPDWTSRFDGDGSIHAAFVAGIAEALRGTGAQFWDGAVAYHPDPDMFGDAVHILWPATDGFSDALATALGLRSPER